MWRKRKELRSQYEPFGDYAARHLGPDVGEGTAMKRWKQLAKTHQKSLLRTRLDVLSHHGPTTAFKVWGVPSEVSQDPMNTKRPNLPAAADILRVLHLDEAEAYDADAARAALEPFDEHTINIAAEHLQHTRFLVPMKHSEDDPRKNHVHKRVQNALSIVHYPSKLFVGASAFRSGAMSANAGEDLSQNATARPEKIAGIFSMLATGDAEAHIVAGAEDGGGEQSGFSSVLQSMAGRDLKHTLDTQRAFVEESVRLVRAGRKVEPDGTACNNDQKNRKAEKDEKDEDCDEDDDDIFGSVPGAALSPTSTDIESVAAQLDKAGAAGVAISSLASGRALHALVDSDRAYCVGRDRAIAAKYSSIWRPKAPNGTSDEGKHEPVVRIWTRFSSNPADRINVQFLNKLKRAMMSLVMEFPGIPKEEVHDRFSFLSNFELDKVLSDMCKEGQLRLRETPQCAVSLWSKPDDDLDLTKPKRVFCFPTAISM